MFLADLRDEIRARLERIGVPGATVGVLGNGQVETLEFGTANLATGQPVMPGSLFRIASITKPMVATLVMRLARQGLLDLDEAVVQVLPSFRLDSPNTHWRDAISLRHLLSHSAGLECELPFNLRTLGDGPDALGRAVAEFPKLTQFAAPGTVMSYGNSGYWLAGHLAANAAGTTFERAMVEYLFEPLAMKRSFFTATQAIVHPVALGHTARSVASRIHRPVRSFAYPRARRASGGVISCVEDLLVFARWHMESEDTAIVNMWQPQIELRESDDEAWGIGWNLRYDTRNQLIAGHGGSYDGYQTQLSIVPAAGFALAILTNSSRGSQAIRSIERLVLSEMAGISMPRQETAPVADLQRFAGRYAQRHARHDIAVDGDGLLVATVSRNLSMVEQPPEPPVMMRPVADTTFMAFEGPTRGTRADFLVDPATGELDWLRIGLRVARRVPQA